ncbi:hypothetical protein [Streptomyces sp. SBT349]|uniref:hypothetical protein n=1 Tax=Streptomyces sp. SBT349 TaxID=1580539 RepID=UPI00066C60EB|nr:hypothetical protein [Streptomyces sp. SBT349]
MTRAATVQRPLPLQTARDCFTWLVTGPKPLSLDGRPIEGLPNRDVPLDELRDRILRRRCPHAARDAVWAQLVSRSRRAGATWTLACAGMALPALASVSGWLAARYPDEDPFDVHAEVLTGFLNGLPTVDLQRPQILMRLKWAAFRAGLTALSDALAAPTPMPPGFESAAPRPPWGHPDLVLARAVRDQVVTRTEADLIGATRLEDESVARWAADHHTTAPTAYKVRRRAEHRLADYLLQRTPRTDAQDPVAEEVTSRLSPPLSGRSRPGGLSRSVARARDGSEETCANENGENRDPLSKTRPYSGLLGCGRKTPAPPEAPTSEVPRCT